MPGKSLLKSYTKFDIEKIKTLRATFLTTDRRQSKNVNTITACQVCFCQNIIIEMELCDDMHVIEFKIKFGGNLPTSIEVQMSTLIWKKFTHEGPQLCKNH